MRSSIRITSIELHRLFIQFLFRSPVTFCSSTLSFCGPTELKVRPRRLLGGQHLLCFESILQSQSSQSPSFNSTFHLPLITLDLRLIALVVAFLVLFLLLFYLHFFAPFFPSLPPMLDALKVLFILTGASTYLGEFTLMLHFPRLYKKTIFQSNVIQCVFGFLFVFDVILISSPPLPFNCSHFIFF